MTGKQTAVLWMGILLIAVQFYFGGQWKVLFGQIRPGPSGSALKTSPAPTPSNPPPVSNGRPGGARHGQ